MKNIEKDIEVILKMSVLGPDYVFMNARDQCYFDTFAKMRELTHLDYIYLRERFRKGLNECAKRGICYKHNRSFPVEFNFTNYVVKNFKHE